MQDLVVIGMGLVGSAALRHASASASVVGIGPAEPVDWAAHAGPYSSHYDSGRITRRLDARREWAVLATRAIEQYPVIEAESGIRFHHPAGLVFVRDDEAGITALQDVAAEVDIPLEVGPVADGFPGSDRLSLPGHFTALAEPGPAGAIDPRLMIEAQHRAAANNGALVARDTVVSVRPALGGYEVLTKGGRTHQASAVLLATGPYGNGLLRRPLAMGARREGVVLGEVDEAGAAALADMPSLIYLLDHEVLDDVYIVPPMRYPDGRLYVKLGGSRRGLELMREPSDMNEWMASSDADGLIAMLAEVLQSILADTTFVSWHAKPCLVTDSISGLPFIDEVEDGLFVAVGGNGHAGKSADAIGSLAADLALQGKWSDDELPADLFTADYSAFAGKTGSRHGR